MTADPNALGIDEQTAAQLAPTGVLRVALNLGNPLLVQKSPDDGRLAGVTVDMAHDIARRLGVPVEFKEFDSAGKVSQCAAQDVWDVAFLAIDPQRAVDIVYSEPYVHIEGTYMVPDDSPIQDVEEVDAPGMTVAVGEGTAYDLFLTRHLSQARIVRFGTSEESMQRFADEGVDVAAGIRQALQMAADEQGGLRVLDGCFTLIKQAAGCPKGRPEASAFLRTYIEHAKRSGFVAESFKRNGQPALFIPIADTSSAPQSRTVRLDDGLSLFVETAGPADAAQCLVLLHSLGMDHAFWDQVAPALSEHARVVTLDLRGHGKSNKPHGPYTIAQMAADVRAALRQLDCGRVLIAGASMGGCVALQFAIDNPDITDGLGLIDTTAWYGDSAAQDWSQRAAKARSEGFGSMVEFQKTRWFGDAFRQQHGRLVEHCVSTFLANDLAGYAASCQALGAFDARKALGELEMPVSIAVGEDDYATPVEMAKAMRDAIAGAELSVIPGARHFTPIEAPGPIIRMLTALARRAGQPSSHIAETKQ